MSMLKTIFAVVFGLLVASVANAQQPDSTQASSTFSGFVGVTNNGFSIIPTFSLNSPAVIFNASWRKNKCSFDPDFRLVPDASKGSLLFWFRYRLVEQKKFSLRVGAHPAFTLVRRNITQNGNTSEITEMLRFAAFEVVPSYQLAPNVGIGAMYLEGHGLQAHGPQLTRVLFLNASLTQLKLTRYLRLGLFPSVFFLHTDGYKGDYLTVTGVLAHQKLPFTLQSTINQTFRSNVPGNQDFMWNVMVAYNFNRVFRPSK